MRRLPGRALRLRAGRAGRQRQRLGHRSDDRTRPQPPHRRACARSPSAPRRAGSGGRGRSSSRTTCGDARFMLNFDMVAKITSPIFVATDGDRRQPGAGGPRDGDRGLSWGCACHARGVPGVRLIRPRELRGRRGPRDHGAQRRRSADPSAQRRSRQRLAVTTSRPCCGWRRRCWTRCWLSRPRAAVTRGHSPAVLVAPATARVRSRRLPASDDAHATVGPCSRSWPPARSAIAGGCGGGRRGALGPHRHRHGRDPHRHPVRRRASSPRSSPAARPRRPGT